VALPVAVLRLTVSVTMSNHSFLLTPDNEYLLVTAKPGWRTLWRIENELGGIAGSQKSYVAAVHALRG